MAINISVTDQVTNFGFSVDAKPLLECLARLEGVTGYTSKSDSGRHHILVAKKKRLYLVGYSDTTYGVIEISGAKVKGSGNFNCPDPARMRQLFKNRGEIEFEYSGNALTYSSVKGRFKGEINTTPITVDQVPRVSELFSGKSKGGSSIGINLLARIREGVKHTTIKDQYMENVLLVYISLDKGRLNINSYDNYHLAMYEAKVDDTKSSFKMAFPASMFDIVDKFVEDEPASFYMGGKSFVVEGHNFLIGLPPITCDDSHFNVAPEYIQSLKKPKAKFNGNLQDAIDNLMALNADGARFEVQMSSKGSVRIQLKTDHGSGSEVVKVDDMKLGGKSITARFDPATFNDLSKHTKRGSGIPTEFYGDDDSLKQCVMKVVPSKGSRLFLLASTI